MRKLALFAWLLFLLARPAQAQIAHDADSNSGVLSNNTTTISWSHTFTGSNRVAYVGCGARDATANNRTVSAVTVGGASATLIGSHQDNTVPGVPFKMSLWRRIAPATGAQTIAVDMAAYNNTRVYCAAVSFTGVDQTTPEDAAATGESTGNATAVGSATPITTVTNNAWLVGFILKADTEVLTQVGNIGTQISAATDFEASLGRVGLSYNGPGTPTGSYYVSWSWGNATPTAHEKTAIRPASGGPPARNRIWQ